MNVANRNPVIMALVATSALGVGVSGTMLYMEGKKSGPPAPAVIVPVEPQEVLPNVPIRPNLATAPSTKGQSKAEAAVSQANFYYDSQQWPQAIEQYRFAIASGLDNPNVRTDLGNSLRFAGKPEKALEQYQIAQKQNPKHEQSLFNQGGLWAFSLNNHAKAIAAWRTYLKRFPNGNSADAARQFLVQYAK